MNLRPLQIVALLVLASSWAYAEDPVIQPERVRLDVAIFAYLPDAAAAIERLEDEFETKYPEIDLDLELWNPYKQARAEDGTDQMSDFDLVEIDVCRLDPLRAQLDELPEALRANPKDCVAGARKLIMGDARRYVIPHWVCGNFLVFWATNHKMEQAKSFGEVLGALDPSKSPLHASMGGGTGLGEFYADALVDLYGPDRARQHLEELSSDPAGSVPLDLGAREAVLALANELQPENRKNLGHFSDHSYVLPRKFAEQKESTLLGYSERLYFTERELLARPGGDVPVVRQGEIVIRQFPFAESSKGTPSWVDGFVVPKGKLAQKEEAIRKFLQYIQSPEAYVAFAQPSPYLSASNLMPAVASAYESGSLRKLQPVQADYLAASDDSFVVDSEKVYLGMRVAGKRLLSELSSN